MADQQYCLRWNNHQPTLAGCFDRMLKDDQFTDCTLSAEGVNVVAHRMLLSACSPYFNELFKEYNKQQFPIVILRDVSVVELKALMDYMYRGEVNISQDQLADLLKVAEMLQIKGLYEAGFSESRASAPAPAASRVSMNAAVARPQPLDLPPDITSDGAASPAPRRRKRVRRRSSSDDFPSTIDVAAEPIGQAVAPATAKTEAVNNILSVSSLPVPPKLEEHQFDVVLPKEEYVDDQDSIENITLDDDDMDEMDQAGPSHGDGSSQGYPPSWHQSDRSTEDIFLSAQDSINNAGGAQRDSQVPSTSNQPTSIQETVQTPEEVILKDEPIEIEDDTPLEDTFLQGIKPYENGSEGRPSSVPMVRLERLDFSVRSSARLLARKSAPIPAPTRQAEDADSPGFEMDPLLPSSPAPSAMVPSAKMSPRPRIIARPKAGMRRYQLILPKPAPGAAADRRRKQLKPQSKNSSPVASKSSAGSSPPKPSTIVVAQIQKVVVPKRTSGTPMKPRRKLPKLRPKSVDPLQTNSLSAGLQLIPPILPQPTTIMVAQQPPPSTIVVGQPQTQAMVMPHFGGSTIVPATMTPTAVKWPLPPKTQSNVSTTPYSVGLQQSKAKKLAAMSTTPTGQVIVPKDVARPVTNGYQCCFCNRLRSSMSGLMTHLRTCSGLAAAKK